MQSNTSFYESLAPEQVRTMGLVGASIFGQVGGRNVAALEIARDHYVIEAIERREEKIAQSLDRSTENGQSNAR